MRKIIAAAFLAIGRWVDPRPLQVIETPVPPTSPLEGYDLVRDRIHSLNEVMHLLPREYYPWINWEARPARVVLCLRADKHIVYAGD